MPFPRQIQRPKFLAHGDFWRNQLEDLLGRLLSMWKWERHFYANIPEGKIALNINLDETSIQLWQSRHRGNVAFRKWRSVRKVRTKFAAKASLQVQRSNITHVAMVCDKTDIQGRLPQFLLASGKVLLARDVPRVNAITKKRIFN